MKINVKHYNYIGAFISAIAVIFGVKFIGWDFLFVLLLILGNNMERRQK